MHETPRDSPQETRELLHGEGHDPEDKEQPVKKQEYPEIFQAPDVLRQEERMYVSTR